MAGLRIGTNPYILKAQRQLGSVTQRLGQNLERLSSGARINRPSDDPSGLAVSSKLRTDSRVYTQGVRNINDGISALNTVEGGLQQLTNLTQRIKELATQAANGVYSLTQRRNANTEANALVNEFNRIVSTTNFNGLRILNGSGSTLGIQAGYGTTGLTQINTGQSLRRTIGDATFKAAATYAAGSSPLGMAQGDFNGDGKMDLVVANETGVNVSVLLGDGSGGFGAATNYSTVGFNVMEVATADFNGDGKLDLAVSTYSSGKVSILLNKGDGTFNTAVTYAANSGLLWGIVSADFNGDGYADIATASNNLGQVAIFLGKGDGTFQTATTVAVGLGSQGLATADLNNDGKLDLAVPDTNGNRVGVLLGNGSGGFGAATYFATGSGPSEVSISDFNEDGLLDIVASNYTSDSVSVLLGKGGGQFKSAVNYTVGTNPESVKTGDFNGDGHSDIVVSNEGSAFLSVLLGDGNGAFSAGTNITAGVTQVLVLGDFNRDGVTDIAGSESSGANIHLANTTTSTTLASVNLSSQAGALAAITEIENALTRISSEFGQIGANQKRLSTALNHMQSYRDNLEAAKHRITDSDTAQNVGELLRLQILQQTSTALLAQGSLEPKIALDLIKNA